mmetsp:Transcript_32097/g.73789  ORF Transcript_32097/g.73789 Transcript_32097/m.73789 type:complete len:234 (+) Transcript_32097:3-704(+)
MLLQANPSSLFAKTGNGQSLQELAKHTATKSHPNFALLTELEKQCKLASERSSTHLNQDDLRDDDDDNDDDDDDKSEESDVCMTPKKRSVKTRARRPSGTSKTSCRNSPRSRNRPRSQNVTLSNSRKRRAEAADLLLHFSRNGHRSVHPHHESHDNCHVEDERAGSYASEVRYYDPQHGYNFHYSYSSADFVPPQPPPPLPQYGYTESVSRRWESGECYESSSQDPVGQVAQV